MMKERGTCLLRCPGLAAALGVTDRRGPLSPQALCRVTRHSPSAFQSVIEKVGLASVTTALASAICRVQQYLLTLFTAMLSCGIHLQRLIQEKVCHPLRLVPYLNTVSSAALVDEEYHLCRINFHLKGPF